MEYHNHFCITLFSNASQKLYPKNTLSEYTIQLVRRIDLGSTDNWEVGLCEFSCPPPLRSGNIKPIDVIGENNVMVYCDLITPQFVGDDYVRCLRTFIHPSKSCDYAFHNIYYVPVEKRTFQDISILIKDINGKHIAFRSGTTPTKVVLHFRRV